MTIAMASGSIVRGGKESIQMNKLFKTICLGPIIIIIIIIMVKGHT